MYESRQRYGVKAYVMMWGVSMKYMTFKHLVEYRFAEEALQRISNEEKREQMKKLLSSYKSGLQYQVWPYYRSQNFTESLAEHGIAKILPVGEGEIICADVFDTVNYTEKAIREDPYGILYEGFHDWYRTACLYMDQ